MEKQATNTGLEQRLRALEPPYASEGQRRIGRILDRYGIPFHYKQAVLVYEEDVHHVWHPDFTLPDYHHLIIEYAGTQNGTDPATGVRHKERIYRANEIPAIFVYPSDLARPDGEEKLYHQIMKTYRQSPDRYRY